MCWCGGDVKRGTLGRMVVLEGIEVREREAYLEWRGWRLGRERVVV
jgi:hypothetical protein